MLLVLTDTGDLGLVAREVTWRQLKTCFELNIPCYLSYRYDDDGLGVESMERLLHVAYIPPTELNPHPTYTFNFNELEAEVDIADLDTKVSLTLS